jgi:antitoxin CcdA
MRRHGSRAVSKRAANVSVRSDLLVAAREAGIDLSATLEQALEKELAEARRKKWREENHGAIAAYNEYIEKHGMFFDRRRRF